MRPDPSSCWCGSKTIWTYDNAKKIFYCTGSKFHDPLKTRGIEPAKVQKLYICGPMSGIEDNNYPLFNRVAALLRAAGFEVNNPAEYGAPEGERVGYYDILREDFKRLLDCDGLALLSGWEMSNGATAESDIAAALQMPIDSWANWLLREREEVVQTAPTS